MLTLLYTVHLYMRKSRLVFQEISCTLLLKAYFSLMYVFRKVCVFWLGWAIMGRMKKGSPSGMPAQM